ncbi:protein BONZAI 3 isoform X1 [Tanacetum coccineum]
MFLSSFLNREINAEQQEQLKGIYEKFKAGVDQLLEKCQRTIKGLETHQVQVKGMFPGIFFALHCNASNLLIWYYASLKLYSDTMGVVYAKKNNSTLEELDRTEVIMNNFSLMWIQKMSVAFQIEIVQPLVFKVYDVDTKYHNMSTKMLDLKGQDFVGELLVLCQR